VSLQSEGFAAAEENKEEEVKNKTQPRDYGDYSGFRIKDLIVVIQVILRLKKIWVYLRD
jgi:hypothetical protein